MADPLRNLIELHQQCLQAAFFLFTSGLILAHKKISKKMANDFKNNIKNFGSIIVISILAENILYFLR